MRCAYQRFGAWLLMAFFVSVFLCAVPARADEAGEAEEAFAAAVAAVHDGDDERAIDILRPSAEAGDVKAMSLLGVLLLGLAKDEQAKAHAREWILRAAEAGDANAQTRISLEYLGGADLPVSSKRVKTFLLKAARAGDPYAQALLASAYSHWIEINKHGRVFPLNASKSKYWAKRAVENGVQHPLGALLLHKLSRIDLRIAGREKYRREIEKLADEGHVLPSLLLGHVYFSGRDVEKNVYIAAKWYKIASYINGQVSMGDAFREEVEAVFYLKSALADNWFLEHADDASTRYGEAATWCNEHHEGELGCLRNAIYHHESCLPPYFPGYFQNYIPSAGYHRCRNEMLADNSLDFTSR